MTAGHTFTLEHFDADGDYVLVPSGTAGERGYRSGGTPDFTYQNTFACLPLDLPFRPAG